MTNKSIYDEKELKIFDSVPEIIIIYEPIFDDKGKIIDLLIRYINSKTVLLTNIPGKEVIGKHISEIPLLGNIKPYLPIAEEIITTGQSKKFDFYLPTLNKYFRISVFRVFNELIATLILDITEDKTNEEELKKNEEKIQDILDGIVESYYELDNEWHFVEVNKNAEMLFSKSKEELLGKIIWDVFSDPGDSEFYREYHRAKEENVEVHFEILSKLNSRWYEVHAYPHPQGLYVYSHDISKRKKAEKQLKKAHYNLEDLIQERTEELEKANRSLKENEEKFREIFNKANDMITLNEMIKGFPGKFIEINEVGVKRLGYSKEELLDMGPADIVDPDKRSEMPENARILTQKGCNTFEIVHVTKDGKKIPVEVNNHLINYKGRKVCLAISRDISERKKAEEEREKLIDELKRSNEELQQFAYVTSHDLQEPLRTIASFTQLLEKRYKGKFDSDADEFMDYIVDAAIRMKQQIQDLLEYSRVTTRTEDFKPVNTEEILKNVLFDLKIIIENNNAKITYDKLPTVMGDREQLTRVFQNLISNAIKFKKPDEPLKIHISARENKEDNEYVF